MENYPLCLYQLREDLESPTMTQMTDYLKEKLVERLDNPKRSPCGQPIPGAGGPHMLPFYNNFA